MYNAREPRRRNIEIPVTQKKSLFCSAVLYTGLVVNTIILADIVISQYKGLSQI